MSETVVQRRQWITAALKWIFLMMKSLMMRSGAGERGSKRMPLGGALVESSPKELVCSFPWRAAGGGGWCWAHWEPRWVETAGVGSAGSRGRVKAEGTVEDGWVHPEGALMPTGGPGVEDGETDPLHHVYLCKLQSSAPIARGLNSPEPSYFPHRQVTLARPWLGVEVAVALSFAPMSNQGSSEADSGTALMEEWDCCPSVDWSSEMDRSRSCCCSQRCAGWRSVSLGPWRQWKTPR